MNLLITLFFTIQAYAAIAPITTGATDAMPPRWNTYIAVDDVNATSEAIAPAGDRIVPAVSIP